MQKNQNMEQQKKDEQQQEKEQRTNSEQGRLPEAATQASENKNEDISQVDEQEGAMDNGELGGNFDAEVPKETA